MFYSSCFRQHSMLSESTESESLVIHNNTDHITLYGYTVKDNFTKSWTTKTVNAAYICKLLQPSYLVCPPFSNPVSNSPFLAEIT